MNPVAFQFYKETRELLPWWLGGVGAMLACSLASRALPNDSTYFSISVFAFLATACGMGGLVIGHEYLHRTLPSLLAQPERRGVLLGVKLFVLASLLIALALVAFFLLGEGGLPGTHTSHFPVLNWQAILAAVGCGFFLAPWLSMVGRGPLAGMLFAVTLPFCVAAVVVFTMNHWEALAVAIGTGGVGKVTLTQLLMLGLWALGGVLTWTTFLRLQALDGAGVQLRLPAWLVRRPMEPDPTEVRRRHPGWLIVKKELRLQQLAFAIAAMYVAAWLAFTWSGDSFSAAQLSIFYALVIPVIIGAPASAEERHLGTASWQALLPVSSAWQWTLKVATAITVTVVLAGGLPFLLSHLAVPAIEFERGVLEGAICLCVASLFISSVSPSGIRAVLTAGLAIVVVLAIGSALFGPFVVVSRLLEPIAKHITPFKFDRPAFVPWLRWAAWLRTVLVIGGGAALLLRFGAANHYSEDHSAARIGKQIAWIAGYLSATLIIIAFLEQLLWAGLRM